MGLMKTDVLCGFWNEGEPAREFWIATLDSDSEDSDYDENTTHGGWREVNQDGYFSDSDDGVYQSDYSLRDGYKFFPGPEYSRYPHAHLRDFSQTAIQKYNQDTGNRFEFLELVEASVHTIIKYAHIVVIFKACQSGVTTSFRAETRSASKSLSDSYDIETVVPLQSHSDVSHAGP